ncbi:MAG: hypothetical protein AB7S48_12990 [Bacteroidales bacterium]
MQRAKIEDLLNEKYHYNILFILGFLFLSAMFYNGFLELNELPKGMHQWKQSMHFSIIQNYIDGSANFWHPAMNNLFNSDNTGKLILEFPIFHKITASVISVFPALSPSLFRWIMLILTFIGFYHAYKLANMVIRNELFAVLSSLLVFAIPVVAFYGANYLVDVPAMAFGFSFIYFAERNIQKWSFLNTVLCILFLALSGLLRLPVLILPLSYIGARAISGKKLLQLLWLLPAAVIIAIWYYYVKKFNTYFVAYPPTETFSYLSAEKLSSTIHAIFNTMVYQFGWTYRYALFYALVSAYLIYNWKKVSRFWFLVLAISVVGAALYVYLWFGIFENHDYYLFPIIPLIFLIWLNVFIVVLKTNQLKNALYLAIIILGINTVNTFDNMRLRTFHKKIKIINVFTGKYESRYWRYFGNEDKEKWKVIRDISPYCGSTVLEDHGIFPTDTVICDFDSSPTYVLALLNLKGWTLYNSGFNTLDDYTKYTNFGAKYLITNFMKVSPLDSASLDILKRNIVFRVDSLAVYDIRSLRQLKPLGNE